MNSNVNSSIILMEQDELRKLVTEVKETVATNVPAINHKNAFSVVDLWNLERTRRNRVTRRHFA